MMSVKDFEKLVAKFAQAHGDGVLHHAAGDNFERTMDLVLRDNAAEQEVLAAYREAHDAAEKGAENG